MAHFSYHQEVLFRHCDQAGIVFYPRYFEMVNDCIEAFFKEVVGWSFAEMHPDAGVPTRTISADFTHPGRQGEMLDFALRVGRVGGSSLEIGIDVTSAGQPRFATRSVLVHVGADKRPARWPEGIRETLERLTEDAA